MESRCIVTEKINVVLLRISPVGIDNVHQRMFTLYLECLVYVILTHMTSIRLSRQSKYLHVFIQGHTQTGVIQGH